MNLHPDIVKAVAKEGYKNTTTIQKRMIPLAIKGADVICASKSGTGKTAAYILPILNRLRKVIKPDAPRVIRALILLPTIELVDQVSHTIKSFGKYIDVKDVRIQGGTYRGKQIERISSGVDIAVATPGRLLSLIGAGKINLDYVDVVVLDEADTMLELGFLAEMKSLLLRTKNRRQTIILSATISQNIKKLAKEFMSNPATVEVSDRRDVVDIIKHRSFKVDRAKKSALVSRLIDDLEIDQMLLFANSKESADKIYEYLKFKKIRVSIMHGDITRASRAKSLALLKSGKTQVLVATDIAARGIDIKELSYVMNYDVPSTTDEFTHRVGRTGRAQSKGMVISLLTTREYNAFAKIERDLKLNIKREIHPKYELTDTQPRQKQPKRKSLREKKGFIDKDKLRKQAHARNRNKSNKSKKTKRD